MTSICLRSLSFTFLGQPGRGLGLGEPVSLILLMIVWTVDLLMPTVAEMDPMEKSFNLSQ